MEGQPSTGNSQYQYQSAQWSRLVRRTTIADDPSIPSPSITVGSIQPTHINLLPILHSQSSSFHQGQLAQYNRLIASGRAARLQSSPLPPLLSAPHIQAVPGSRSGSSGGNTARNNKFSGRGGHGNKEARKTSKGERALMTEKADSATMPVKQFESDLKNQLTSRPLPRHQVSNISHQSSSVPSTPHTHARHGSEYSFESREPSPHPRNNHSPRSAYSESNITLPSSRQLPALQGRCRFETAAVQQRRRMGYDLGNEKLPKLDEKDVKSKLSEDEERKLTTDMRELYDRLKPSAENDLKRKQLVEKLETLFNKEWPGNEIRVHVFGSSGNLLCTDESDVDICITTAGKDLENVCMVAELLARSGMQDIICVSGAKIPIVKMVDPESKLLCDMNINSTEALENTRLIKTYVEIDPRVRPLAMIIKHWTKRRIVNDAGSGYTLSSYTWINMIVNFLQTRKPPILPSLHQRPHLKLPFKNGKEPAFADNLDSLRGFGRKNDETLGGLLFGFFRFYGHEFDYDKSVISVRSGKQISKEEKGWTSGTGYNREFCVEEPFNITRNLANTADEFTVRGLHLELRRAFDLLSNAKLDECCEQYVWPKEEKSRGTGRKQVHENGNGKGKAVPIRSASQSQSSRGSNRGRGGRNSHNSRNGNSNRRASAGTFDSHTGYLPGNLPTYAQDTWLQQQAQAQLSNDLYQTYTALQQQENNLRIQLFNQSQAYLQANQNQLYSQAQPRSAGNGSVQSQTSDRNRTNSFDRGPLTAPVQQELMYYYPIHQPAIYGYPSSSTNPSSPSMSSAQPELRRSVHRSSVTNGSNGQSSSAMRSHSQPAAVTRSGPSPVTMQGGGIPNTGLGIYQNYRHVNGHPIPNFIADENSEPGFETNSDVVTTTPPDEIITPRKYAGYYLGTAPPPSQVRRPMAPLAIPSFGDMQQNRRRQSTDHLPPSVAATLNRMQQNSRSPSPLGNDRSGFGEAHSAPLTAASSQQGIFSSNLRALNNHVPPVPNGSIPIPISIPQWRASVSVGSEDRSIDTEISQSSGTGSTPSVDGDCSGQLTPREHRIEPPMVVNGSTSGRAEAFPALASPAVVNGGSAYSFNTPSGLALAEHVNGVPRLSPNAHSRLAHGGMSPLDIGLGQSEGREDLQRHLSPVLETRTPSPTANRKFEPGVDRKSSVISVVLKDEKAESSKPPSKLGPINGNQLKQAVAQSKVANGHTRGSKSEGAPIKTWQKVQPPKKKGTVQLATQIETPPVHESERMGG